MSGWPFIVLLKRRPESGHRAWEPVRVEAVIDWEDRIATLGLFPPRVAGGHARQSDGTAVDVEEKTWRQIQHEAGAPIPASLPLSDADKAELLRAWNEAHGIGLATERG